MENCNKSYLIADHTKFDNTALCKINDVANFEAVITDQCPSSEWIEFFESINVAVFYPS
jgi:DeoR family myo-inositol catabolism operon transcriptional repressor